MNLESIKERLSLLRGKRKLFVLTGIILVITLFIVLIVRASKDSSGREVQVSSDKATKAKATVNIGKTFEFKAVNASKETKLVKFTIVLAEIKDEIRVKNEPRRAASGRDYLLVRLEVENELTERVAIASTDRIRLIGEGDKPYASDYNNGNVVIDPLSVRRDILAFVVDEKVKKFTFSVGELDGEKQRIEINF